MRKTGFLLVSIALLFGVSSVAFAGIWYNFRYDASHTANNATENINVSALTWKWSKYVGNVYGSDWSLPVVTQRNFFVGVRDNQGKWIKHFRLANGAELYKHTVATTYIPSSVVADGGGYGHYIAGDEPYGHIDAYTTNGGGQPLWTSPPTGSQNSVGDPVVAQVGPFTTAVLVAASGSGGDIYAFSIAGGSELWHRSVINGGGGSPAVAGGRVFATYPGQYYALDAATGAVIWHHDFGISGGGGTTPVATSNTVYMIDSDWTASPSLPTVFAFDAATGSQIWKRSYAYTDVLQEMALRSDALFVVTGTRMEALNPATGGVLWVFAPDTDLRHAPVIAGNLIFVASDTKTYAVDATTHAQVWSANVGGKVVVASGWVLVTESTGWIHAYFAQSGRQ